MNTLTNQRRPGSGLLSKLPVDDDEMTLRFEDANPMQENFTERLSSAQKELEEVRRRAEELERKKTEYEALSQKRERFLTGKSDLIDKFNRAFARLDRETYEAQTRIDELQQIKDGFSRHLAILDGLTPESWSRTDLQNELIKALGCIEDASEEYERAVSRLQPQGSKVAAEWARESGSGGLATSGAGARVSALRDFAGTMKRGLAFTFPAMVFATVMVAVVKFL